MPSKTQQGERGWMDRRQGYLGRIVENRADKTPSEKGLLRSVCVVWHLWSVGIIRPLLFRHRFAVYGEGEGPNPGDSKVEPKTSCANSRLNVPRLISENDERLSVQAETHGRIRKHSTPDGALPALPRQGVFGFEWEDPPESSETVYSLLMALVILQAGGARFASPLATLHKEDSLRAVIGCQGYWHGPVAIGVPICARLR